MDAVVSIPGAEPWSAPGHGPAARTAVIVVHGFTANPVGTRPLGQRLAGAGYAVEVPLLPGHGTSHRDLGRTRYGDWSGAIDELVDHLAARCDEVVLVGHSMGGTIAVDLASRRPDDVAAVVAINPQVLDPTQPLARLAPVLQYLVPFLPRELAGLPTNDLARPDVDESAYPVVPSRSVRSLLVELPRIRRQVLDLTQPLLVIRSPEDHSVPPQNALALLELTGSRDLREVVCERSYHVPQLDHDAELVEAAILDFLADVTGR